jgi:hypothetical protein
MVCAIDEEGMGRAGTPPFSLVMLILFFVLFSVASLVPREQYSIFGGYYQRGKVSLDPFRFDTVSLFVRGALHEYGHYAMDKRFEKGDLKSWVLIVSDKNCSMIGPNQAIYKTRSTKVSEEFADCFAASFENLNCDFTTTTMCSQKLDFVKKYR